MESTIGVNYLVRRLDQSRVWKEVVALDSNPDNNSLDNSSLDSSSLDNNSLDNNSLGNNNPDNNSQGVIRGEGNRHSCPVLLNILEVAHILVNGVTLISSSSSSSLANRNNLPDRSRQTWADLEEEVEQEVTRQRDKILRDHPSTSRVKLRSKGRR
jgi:hypothetical protein